MDPFGVAVALVVLPILTFLLGFLFERLRLLKLRADTALKDQQLASIKQQLQDYQQRLLINNEETAVLQQDLVNAERQLAVLQSKHQGIESINIGLDQQIAEHKAVHQALLEKYQHQLAKVHQLQAQMNERDLSRSEQIQQFSTQKQALKTEFENLANKVFDEKQSRFSEQSKQSLDQLLVPFREQITGFQKRVNDVHSESVKSQSALEVEIKKVLDIGLQMQGEANNLASALKGDSQKRGAWGEAQLQRTLEMSGLVEGAHFDKQSAFKDADGRNKQTDYLVKLPDNKQIIIDSKVTLNAYDQMVACSDNADEYGVALDAHANAVKRHIDDLSAKDYSNLIGMHSPSFVLLFMPIEPAYIDALKYSKRDLFSYGYEKNIILVSHTTLIPILRTVANLWMLDDSNKEAREISEKAGDIYNQLCVVAERVQKLGNSLNAVSNHYNGTVKALAGQQGLHGKVERFSKLSNKVTKTLPELDALRMDHDSERLDMMVEAVPDSHAKLDTDSD